MLAAVALGLSRRMRLEQAVELGIAAGAAALMAPGAALAQADDVERLHAALRARPVAPPAAGPLSG